MNKTVLDLYNTKRLINEIKIIDVHVSYKLKLIGGLYDCLLTIGIVIYRIFFLWHFVKQTMTFQTRDMSRPVLSEALLVIYSL